jgi:LemA protein
VNRPKWLIPVAIVVGVLLVIILPLIGSYNNLVEREATVDQSFADLDVQLQRRNDLIPNLVSAVRAVLKQEQTVFIQIAEARSRYGNAGTVQEKADANQELESALSRLLVIVENNPDLRSNENVRDLMTQLEGTENRVAQARNVRDLMTQLEGTENRVAQARREYNGAVTPYNVYVKRFPRRIVASMFGFDPKPLFAASPEARNAPDANLDDAFDTTPAPSG